MSRSLELLEQVVALCRDRRIMLRVAESCTGGRLSSYFTKLPGSSDYFDYGVVTYSNSAKHNILKIPISVLDRYGAVSAETALLMAEHLNLENDNRYLAISTTGFCGPKINQSDEVGLVYVAVYYNHYSYVERFMFNQGREGNMELAVEAALAMAIEALT